MNRRVRGLNSKPGKITTMQHVKCPQQEAAN